MQLVNATDMGGCALEKSVPALRATERKRFLIVDGEQDSLLDKGRQDTRGGHPRSSGYPGHANSVLGSEVWSC